MSATSQTLRLYTAEYAKHPWWFMGALLMGPAFALQNIISPLFMVKILGELATHHPVNIHYVWWAAISLISGAVIAQLADKYCSMPLTARVMHNLYNKCLSRLMSQEYAFFADSFSGSLVTQTSRFVKGYEMFSNVIYLDMLGLWCGVIAAIGIMIYYNAALGGVIGLIWVLAIVLVMFLVRRRIPHRRAAVAKESQLTGELADVITNAVTIKSFASEALEVNRYQATNQERNRRSIHSWNIAINNHFTLQLLCIGLQLLVLIGGIVSIQHGSLTIATFLLFQVYTLRIIDSIVKASIQMRLLEGVFGDASEMTEILYREPVVQDASTPEKSHIKNGTIELAKVVFSYQESDAQMPLLFRDFSLKIAAGEKIGLVGPSGGGKTTITKLLLRFMDIQGGTITIDGQNIQNLKQEDLHQAISYVPQEPLLFHRSLLENIAYGKPTASKADVIAAAKRAYAHEFISNLPHGYDTLVGERGVKLSGGQRQRVAIARAILKDAPVLILDEATSALDSSSEKYIQKALGELMQGKTSVVIAHRLSTIQHLDRIIVLDEGKIVEQGSHQELLSKKGLYAKLWAHQSGGFIEE